MWCRHCQQDVPAISRAGDAVRVCPRCASPLRRQPLARPPQGFDAGVELDAVVATAAERPPVASPLDALGAERQLAQIRRRLRPIAAPRYEAAPAAGATTLLRRDESPRDDDFLGITHERETLNTAAELDVDLSPVAARSKSSAKRASQRPGARWVASIVILTLLGSAALMAGVAMLLASSAMSTAPTAVRGMTLAFAGQGLLYFALAGMAARAWRGTTASD